MTVSSRRIPILLSLSFRNEGPLLDVDENVRVNESQLVFLSDGMLDFFKSTSILPVTPLVSLTDAALGFRMIANANRVLQYACLEIPNASRLFRRNLSRGSRFFWR